MLKHKRLVSIIATIAFCLSFLAPALLAPAPAVASSTYTALNAPPISTGNNKALGTVKIKIDDVTTLTEVQYLTVALPSGVTFENFAGAGAYGDPSTAASGLNGDVTISTPANLDGSTVTNPFAGGVAGSGAAKDGLISAKATSANSLSIKFDPAFFTGWNAATNTHTESGPAQFNIGFALFEVTGASGDINASFSASANTVFSSGAVVIGKVTGGGGSTIAAVKSVKTVTKQGNQLIDQILIYESNAGTFQVGDKITVKLPSGFTWDVAPVIVGSWGMDGYSSAGGQYTIDPASIGTQKLTFRINFVPAGNTSSSISIGAVLDAANAGLARIGVPDSAPIGDVVAEISATNDVAGTSTNITSADVVVAKVGEYGVTVAEGTKTELFNGSTDNTLGSFTITESVADSLLTGRSIKLTLPDGVKWAANPTVTVVDGDALLTGGGFNVVADTDNRSITQNVANVGARSITTLKIEKGKVDIAPSFSGPITIKISGTAGVAGEVTVADVKPRIELTADTPKDVVIGLPDQDVADVTIKENKKGAIMDSANFDTLVFSLPDGFTFSATPTVTVSEGDLAIDSVKVQNDDTQLKITIKSSSRTASTLKISGIKVTSTRYVPEGGVKLTLAKVSAAGVGSTAIDETTAALFPYADRTSPANVIIAKCVTPAPADQGRNASFYIGSTIMNVNGSNIIMDAAPYIKAGRTYVPVRYLGDALGATTAWDADTKTVTVTKGDNTVVLVIGSTVAKVNGADVQMDVAPEITGVGRTMLPARWVAEGLGYQVGWNAVLQQVVIQ
ncbi:MAG: stalk domain-containing protein [Syntrophomonadales bacterium]